MSCGARAHAAIWRVAVTRFNPGRQDVFALIDAAVRAPSADNYHAFRIALLDDGLEFIAEDIFLQGKEAHRRLLILLAYGAAAENLRLALTRYGWTFKPRWFPDADDPACLLRIRWDDLDATAVCDSLASRIASRHTNRRLFRRERASESDIRSIVAAAKADDVDLHWFDAGPRRRALLRMVRLAEAARFNSPSLHAELFESIDFSAGWRASAEEHLGPVTLEVEPFLRQAFAALRHPRVMRLARLGGVHHLLGLRAGYLPAATSPHLGAMNSALPPDLAALAIGCAFQRLWLAADAAGLSLQPMVASAILAWQCPCPDTDSVRMRLQQRLRSGWASLLDGAPPLIVFRLGMSGPPTAISRRKPVEHYLIEHRRDAA